MGMSFGKTCNSPSPVDEKCKIQNKDLDWMVKCRQEKMCNHKHYKPLKAQIKVSAILADSFVWDQTTLEELSDLEQTTLIYFGIYYDRKNTNLRGYYPCMGAKISIAPFIIMD